MIPGLILGLLLGVGPLVVAYGLVRKPVWRWTTLLSGWTGEHWAWLGAVVLGAGVVGWIIVQVLIVPDHSAAAWAVQASTALLGLAIVALVVSESVRRHYRLATTRRMTP